MNTEITENTVFYDADCGFCTGLARRLEVPLGRRGFALVPLQDPHVPQLLHLGPADLLAEMRLVLANGKVFGGADAVVEIARKIWWAVPLVLISKLPGGEAAFRAMYRQIAAHRHCVTCHSGTCHVQADLGRGGTLPYRLLAWVPLAVFASHAMLVRNELPAWLLMWLLAWGIFFGCKFVTWQLAWLRGGRPTVVRSLGYLFAWPGMNATAFLASAPHRPPEFCRSRPNNPRSVFHPPPSILNHDAIAGILYIALGAALVAIAARGHPAAWPMARGWAGMVGVVLLLHFGLFRILALAWNHSGAPAEPIMRSPLSSTSLQEFWGRRWNTAFNALAHDLVFRPLVPRLGPSGAMLAVFLISGLVHEAVISLPARGGYGLPTAYFAIQAMGIALERSRIGRRLGLGRGRLGWAFAMLCAGLPAFALFHPPFIHNVILPMLDAIGAKKKVIMKASTLTFLLQIAGLLHLGLICAGSLMPRAVSLPQHLAGLPGFIRHLFWVYYSFVALCLVSFGTITYVFAGTLARGDLLSKALCLFLAAFWSLRFIAATFILDVRPYLTNAWWRLGYYATNVVFTYLPVVYLAAAFKGATI